MAAPSTVFDRHYKDYMDRLARMDLDRAGTLAGARSGSRAGTLTLSYFSRDYTVSGQGITGPEGNKVSYDTGIILCRYLIMADEQYHRPGAARSQSKDWKGFRDLRESGPLTVYFSDNVEAALARTLAGRFQDAWQRLSPLNGIPADLGAGYDLALEIQALPRIPLLLLFNDAEEGFPPTCSVLFQGDVETLLDAECIAMVGSRLASLAGRLLSSSPP